jgi:hypothetical protein
MPSSDLQPHCWLVSTNTGRGRTQGQPSNTCPHQQALQQEPHGIEVALSERHLPARVNNTVHNADLLQCCNITPSTPCHRDDTRTTKADSPHNTVQHPPAAVLHMMMQTAPQGRQPYLAGLALNQAPAAVAAAVPAGRGETGGISRFIGWARPRQATRSC